MLRNLTANWKTTAAGFTSIIAVVTHLVFAAIHGKADESMWTTSLIQILAAFGLLAAGDASQGKSRADDLEAKLNDTVAAVKTGDTSILEKKNIP